MASVLIKKGNLNTDMHRGRTPQEDESRDWENASTSQGRPKIAGKPPVAGKLGEKHGTAFPSETQEEPTLLTP